MATSLKAEFYKDVLGKRVFEIKDKIDGPIIGRITYVMIRINDKDALIKGFENENIKDAESFIDELNKIFLKFHLVDLNSGYLGRESNAS